MRLTAELARLEPAHKPLIKRAGEARRLFDAARRWLDEQPDPAALVVVAVPPVRVADLATELATVRTQLVALTEEADTIARAPLPVAEALARLDESINATADLRKPHVGQFFAPTPPSGRYRTPLVPAAMRYLAGGLGDIEREVAFEAFVVAMLREPLSEALRRVIKASVPSARPIPSAERPKRLAALAEKRRGLEEREEAIILTAEAAGLDLDRRAEAPPEVVVCTVIADAAA